MVQPLQAGSVVRLAAALVRRASCQPGRLRLTQTRILTSAAVPPALIIGPTELPQRARVPYCHHESDMSSILDLQEHRDLWDKLQYRPPPVFGFGTRIELQVILRTMVYQIFNLNISVKKLALETKANIVTPKDLRYIDRKRFSQNLPQEIVTSNFAKHEDKIIERNWASLLEVCRLTHAADEVIEVLFENSTKAREDKLCKAVVGHWLSQKLARPRLPADVLNRLRLRLMMTQGRFSREEDQQILAWAKENTSQGRQPIANMAELGARLGRNQKFLTQRYCNLESGQTPNIKSGLFSTEESKYILKAVFDAGWKLDGDGDSVKKTVFEKIGSSLMRKPKNVQKHWRDVLFPLLARHKAGNTELNYYERLIHYLAERGYRDSQEVDWAKVAALPEFAGATGSHLARLYHSRLRNARLQFSSLPPEQVSPQHLVRWWTTIRKRVKNDNKCKGEDELLEYYCQKILKL